MRWAQLFLASGWLVFAGSCQPEHDAPATTSSSPPTRSRLPVPKPQVAPPKVAPAPKPSAAVLNPATDARLVAVRQLVAHLNTQPRQAWARVQKVELYESTEGGEAVFYYLNGQPQKITAVYLGETGQQQTTFYLRNNLPAFVLEQFYQYNRPITQNLAAMRERGDKEVFDFAKSTITTARSYFDHGQLIYQTERPANDSTKVAAYRLRAQYRLAGELRQLLVQAATK